MTFRLWRFFFLHTYIGIRCEQLSRQCPDDEENVDCGRQKKVSLSPQEKPYLMIRLSVHLQRSGRQKIFRKAAVKSSIKITQQSRWARDAAEKKRDFLGIFPKGGGGTVGQNR